MEELTKLISVIILSYRSEDVLSRAISSVLVQDYPRVELIITDDGSEGFSAEKVTEIIESGKTDRLESYRVLANEKNEGTVANLWHALDVFTGDYFMVIGADDAYASPTTLSEIISVFKYHLWKPLLVTGVAEMWSEDMNVFQREIPSVEGQLAIRSGNSKMLYEALCGECVVPIVATCFKREFIKIVDAFDRRYKYYEDYPTFLRMARNGVCPYFADIVVVKHAAGGIANSSSLPNLKLAVGLHRDRALMWETEYQPYKGALPDSAIQAYKKRRKQENHVFRVVLKAYGLSLVEAYEMYPDDRVLQLDEKPKEEVQEQSAVAHFFTENVIPKAETSAHCAVTLIMIAVSLMIVFQGENILAFAFALVSGVFLVFSLWFIVFGLFAATRRLLK